MLSSPTHRGAIRTLCFISLCVAVLTGVSLRASRQQARTAEPREASGYLSPQLSASDSGAITPAGNTITVNSTADVANSTDGLCTLREAIAAANSNTASGLVAGECAAGSSSGSDTINLTGVNGTITLTSALPDITSDMTINGPGPSTLTVQRSTAGGTPQFRIFRVRVDNPGVVTFSGLRISNGSDWRGGGIYNQNGDDRDFNRNFQNTGTVNVMNSTLSGNATDDFGNGDGGGVFNSGTLTLLNCTVSNNTAILSRNGGGVYNRGTATLTGVTMSGNIAQTGGGLYNEGTLTLTNSIVSGNIAAGDTGSGLNSGSGGGIGNGGVLTLTSSTVSGNHAANGGGINNGGVLTVMNSTVSGNSAVADLGYGGGIRNGGGTINVINSTVSNNSAISTGGGISQQSPNSVRLRNSIVALNTCSAGSGMFPDPEQFDLSGDQFITQGHNLIGIGDGRFFTNGVNGDIVGTRASPINPLLAPLGNYGGPTQTMALLPGSPTIDAGDNCVAQAAHCGDASITQLTTDQRGAGFNRSVDGNGDGTATVDIGAFESRGFTITATSGTPQSATITNNFSAPLVATVSSASGEPVATGTVIFTAPGSGPRGTFAGSSTSNATISSSGVATSSTFTANNLAGTYNVVGGANGIVNTAAFTLTNTKAATSTSVTSLVNPSDSAEIVTFSATVSSVAGTPTGTVQFKIDGVNSGSPVTLDSSGVAQFATSLITGTHTIAADYNGDTNFIASGGTLAGGQVVKSPPTLSIDDVSITEDDAGTKSLNFTVTRSAASNATASVNFATSNGTATTPSDYTAVPTTALTFTPGQTTKTVSVTINGDQTFEADESFTLNLSNPVNATISKAQGTGTILNDDAQGGIISYSLSNYNVGESAGFVTITINRSGDLSGPATVDYATGDPGAPAACGTNNGKASSRCDFTTVAGRVTFAAGDGQKTFRVLLTQDNYVEGPEMFTLSLANLTGGAVFGVPTTATVTIADSVPQGPPNPIDDAQNFVRQHYHDFLNREPDASGLAFWTNQITSCGSDQACIELRRINVSAAFYLSVEFQETGYLVEKLYKASYGDVIGTSVFGGGHQLPVPVVRFNEFFPDTQEIGQGVVVGQSGWEQVLESNKVAFTLRFVQRARFTTAYPTFMTPAEFVDKLFLNAGVTATPAERQAAIGEFGGSSNTVDVAARGRALRRVAENTTLSANEFNRAFVLMAYFGYLRRNPNEAPDSDYTGYDFWLTKLNQFNGNFVNAEMVKAFIVSSEYRQRFGP